MRPTGHDSTAQLTVCELGELGVRVNGEWVPVRGSRTAAVLSLLALHRTGGARTDRLLDTIWPRPSRPASARQSLANIVARFRSRFGHDFINSTGSGYVLGESVASDRRNFLDTLLRAEESLEHDPEDAAALVDSALDLWRGTPWVNVDEIIDFQTDRTTLEYARRRALRVCALARIRAGSPTDAIGPLEALLDEEPLNEANWATLARAFHQSGRRTEALRTVTRARRNLGEVGLTPAQDLLDLESAILGTDDPVTRQRDSTGTDDLQVARHQLLGRCATHWMDGSEAAALWALEEGGEVLGDRLAPRVERWIRNLSPTD